MSALTVQDKLLLERERRRRIRSQARESETSQQKTESIMDFFCRANPKHLRPTWLSQYIETMETAIDGAHRICVAVPPRHGKTTTFEHAVTKLLWRYPWARIGYCTYSSKRARRRGGIAQKIAIRDGLELDPRHLAAGDWRTKEGGGLYSEGVGGAWTGEGFDFIYGDDLLKNREEANSPTYRRRAWDWVREVSATRMQPNGSVYLVHTRWHPQDPIGLALREQREVWSEITLKAIENIDTPQAKALAPELWPLEVLERKRLELGPVSFECLYQQRPVSQGGQVFGDPVWVATSPLKKFSVSRGADFAYTLKSSGDWSAYVELHFADGPNGLPLYVIADLVEQRSPVEVFSPFLKARISGPPLPLFRYGGQEETVANLMTRVGGLKVISERTKGDKYLNAQDFAAAWNTGRVLIPRDARWVQENSPERVTEILERFTNFTGLDGDTDDVVDAAVSAFKQSQRIETPPSGFGEVNAQFLKREDDW